MSLKEPGNGKYCFLQKGMVSFGISAYINTCLSTYVTSFW